MKKKIYAFFMALVILVGALGTVVNAEETDQAQEEKQVQVTLEEAQSRLKELSKEEKESIRGKEIEEKMLFVPTIEDIYFNDFAQMYEADAEEVKTLRENAKKIKEEDKINFVICTIDSFEVKADDYAGLMHDVYETDIILVISDEEIGLFSSYDGQTFELNEKVQKEVDEFLENKKLDNLLELQNSLLKVYKEEVLKEFKFVVDKEKVFSEEEIETLNNTAEEYKKESEIEILIVTSTEKVSTKELDKYSKNLWICVVLNPDNKSLDVLVSKEAEQYITNLNVIKICNGIKEDFEKEDYEKAMVSLQKAFIKHLKDFDANIDDKKMYRKVEVF